MLLKGARISFALASLKHCTAWLIASAAGAASNLLNDKEETPLEIAKNADVCRIVLGNRVSLLTW